MTDEEVAEMMGEYAAQAVVQAQRKYGVELDFSEQSLLRLDGLLTHVTSRGLLAVPAPGSEEEEGLWLVAKAYGGYLGEVMRRHLDATWLRGDEGEEIVIQMRVGAIICWPPQRVWKRLTADAHDTVFSYYRYFQHHLGRPLLEPKLPQQPWWKRFF